MKVSETQRLWAAMFLLVAFSFPVNADAQNSDAAFLHNGVTAHRGNSGEFPENTVSAFASGIELGADWIELDIFRTKDGKLVVIHDRTTQRVGDRRLVVTESTYEELAQVDVATDFRKRQGKSLDDCPPRKIPLLEDVLRLVMQQNRTRVSIQPKMDCVVAAVALVKELQAERWVGFNDGNLGYMSEVKRLAPEIPVFWDRPARTDIDEDIRVAQDRGFEALVLHYSGITAEKVQKVKAAGIEIGAWTVNDRDTMERLLDLGVERIYTDYPGLLLARKAGRRFQTVQCEGVYPHHLQGVCADDEAIYWCFTTMLVKTDLTGKLLKKVPVANHHGDLCFHKGKVYVAVNLGRFNRPAGQADSWVYVYDAETLEELARHPTPEVVHGAGGMAYHAGRFIVIGGLPEGVEENYLYEYNESFQFQKRHVLTSGYTRLGLQTATFANDRWWFGCYGNALLVTDADFNLKGRHSFNCSLGIEGLPDGRFLAASGRSDKEKGCTGRVRLAVMDDQNGLRYVE